MVSDSDAFTHCGTFMLSGLPSAFFLQQYKQHERSREAIEGAFDTILQKKYKLRHKYGFRPPVTGRKSDLAGDEEVGCSLC